MGHFVSTEDASSLTITPTLPNLAVFYSYQYTKPSAWAQSVNADPHPTSSTKVK